MSKFGSKEEILSSIQALFENIQSGSLTADEMESLVELTRELHERALILRYKSYEEKIFGIAPTKVEVQMEETFEEIEAAAEVEEISEEPHILSFEEVEEEILEHEKQEVTNDEPVFDFDMFEKAEEEDIFSPEMVIEPKPELEATIFEEPISPETDVEPEVSEPISEDAFEVESTPIFSEPEPVEEPGAEVDTDIFNRYSSNTDDSLSSRLMSSKLHTLVGSFGLNDKLQCIRELFKGSSEAFNQAIEQLDNQADFSAAKRILAQFAQQYSWDLESNLTAEFIQKVERRYL